MKTTATLLLFLFVFATSTLSYRLKEERKKELPFPLEYVDEYIGTGSFGYGIGHNNPGAQSPFGAMRLGPDTSLNNIYPVFCHFGGYYYHDSHIRAFSHTHLVGAGLPDYGNFGVMPLSIEKPSNNMIKRHNYRSEFSHETEDIYPGYYSVYLDDHQVLAELVTTGTHSGIHRYSYEEGKPKTILIDVCHTVQSQMTKLQDDPRHSSMFKSQDIGFFESSSKPDFTQFTSDEKMAPSCALGSLEIIDEPTEVKVRAYVLNRGSLTGRNGRGVDVYFFGSIPKTNFELELEGFGSWNDGKVEENVKIQSNVTTSSIGLYLYFGDSGTELSSRQVVMNVGISFISHENAEKNSLLQRQNRTFDQALEVSSNIWAEKLSSVANVETTVEKEKIKFYTSLFRTFMSPTIYSEADGSYLGFDNNIHFIEEGRAYYSDLSLWDTFRTQAPWLGLIQPSVETDVIRSLILMYQQGGDFPRWPIANVYTGCMFGDNCNLLVLDAYVKGLRDFDLAAAYPGLRQSAMMPRQNDGREAINEYIQYGYVPLDNSRTGTGLTLSYAYTDYALSVLAEALGIEEDVILFRNRSLNYKNVFDSETQFMCPKYSNGTFKCPQYPAYPFHENYVEGNVWHYNFDVPHDLEGMVNLYPSKEAFIEKLEKNLVGSTETDEFLFQSNWFPNPYYWQGNEHDLLFPWLFHAGDREDLTQYWTRWILENRYSEFSEGLPGNDDYGTMSAWYCFGSLGFYPVTGEDWYFVGSPVFDDAQLRVPDGNGGISTIHIIAHNNSKTNVYVERVLLNGQELTEAYLYHHQLLSSPTIEFWMTDQPTQFFKH